jgi:hypothetical protein
MNCITIIIQVFERRHFNFSLRLDNHCATLRMVTHQREGLIIENMWISLTREKILRSLLAYTHAMLRIVIRHLLISQRINRICQRSF